MSGLGLAMTGRNASFSGTCTDLPLCHAHTRSLPVCDPILAHSLTLCFPAIVSAQGNFAVRDLRGGCSRYVWADSLQLYPWLHCTTLLVSARARSFWLRVQIVD